MFKTAQTGFTALELMVVVAIVAILAALAAPSFSIALEKQRITGAAEAVLSDLRWARAEAIKRNKTVSVTYVTGSSWSYTINADPAGSDTLLKTVNGSNFLSTTLSSTAFAGGVAYTSFEPVRGTNLNYGTITIATTHFTASVTVNILGKPQICGTMGGGYDTCP